MLSLSYLFVQDKDKAPADIEVRPTNHLVTNPLAPSLPPPSAPSEISSSDFTSAMSPDEILRGFRQHVVHRQKEGGPGSTATGAMSTVGGAMSTVGGAMSRGTSTKGALAADAKHGLLSKYDYKRGTQYYRDLAGNIKEVLVCNISVVYSNFIHICKDLKCNII